jgi:hypothetical protein
MQQKDYLNQRCPTSEKFATNVSTEESLSLHSWASTGAGKRGLLPSPPWSAKIVCFQSFLQENTMFLSIFRQIVCFCPPLEKSLRTPMDTFVIKDISRWKLGRKNTLDIEL